MVQTYVLQAPDQRNAYYRSARTLDLDRARKQIVEAKQILNVLKNAKAIKLFYQKERCLPDLTQEDEESGPENYARLICDRLDEYDSIYSTFRSRKTVLIIQEGVMFEVSKEESKKYVKLSEEDVVEYLFEEEEIVVWEKKIPRKGVELIKTPRDYVLFKEQSEEMISSGFVSHPAARMWVGYIPALEEYIRSHVLALTSSTPTRPKPSHIVFPWWSFSDSVIATHQASVLRKEHVRREKRHYWGMTSRSFMIGHDPKWINVGYIWPVRGPSDACKMTFDDLVRFLKGEDLPTSLAAPITTDDKPTAQFPRKFSEVVKKDPPILQSGEVYSFP